MCLDDGVAWHAVPYFWYLSEQEEMKIKSRSLPFANLFFLSLVLPINSLHSGSLGTNAVFGWGVFSLFGWLVANMHDFCFQLFSQSSFSLLFFLSTQLRVPFVFRFQKLELFDSHNRN